jgi:hypothetical protein
VLQGRDADDLRREHELQNLYDAAVWYLEHRHDTRVIHSDVPGSLSKDELVDRVFELQRRRMVRNLKEFGGCEVNGYGRILDEDADLLNEVFRGVIATQRKTVAVCSN